MNSDILPPDPAPNESGDGSIPNKKPDEPARKPRRHLLGLPPGYKFDPKAVPTADDLGGIPACFGDDEPSRPGQGRTECDKLSVGD
jgi:hypothetical protein